MPITTKVVSSNPVHGDGVLYTTLCDKICQCLATCRWFSLGTPVSSTNKTDCRDLTEILLKVVLNTFYMTSRGFFILVLDKSEMIFPLPLIHILQA